VSAAIPTESPGLWSRIKDALSGRSQQELLELVRVSEERSRHAEQQLRAADSLLRTTEERSRTLEHQLVEVASLLKTTEERLRTVDRALDTPRASAMELLNTHFHRNSLPSDDAAMQKAAMAAWRLGKGRQLSHSELVESGFRTFSQNDEDGILLRLFTQIGTTNRNVVEIGSNCAGSAVGIPENLSANLIVNHGWHGIVFDIDAQECARMRHFFAREHATRHFHWSRNGQTGYISPVIQQQAISPENINAVLVAAGADSAPDLMIVDIDSIDYSVVRSLEAVRPRVLVVEFERRFRDRYSVVQFDPSAYGGRFAQSGSASLAAWNNLLAPRGYRLVAIGGSGFNAFFVLEQAGGAELEALSVEDAFGRHPIFRSVDAAFWLEPDPSWEEVS
jgi:hypothetical protein